MITKHIHNSNRWQRNAVQVGPLVNNRTHQQAAVRAALQHNVSGRGVALGNHIFGRRNAIVEHVLLLHQSSGAVPILAILATATQIHLAVDSALLKPDSLLRAKFGRQRNVETAVAVHPHFVAAIEFDIFFMNNEHWDASAILACVKHLFCDKDATIEIDVGLAVKFRFIGVYIVFVDGRW